jgi:PAS domain S-box-containing protein
MNTKALRVIFLLFGVMAGVIGWLFHFFNFELTIINTNVSLLLISGICLLLFGLSFLKFFKTYPCILNYTFKSTIGGWFIIVTALNHFPTDYSYFIIFIILMLGMMYANSRGFALFYLGSLFVLMFLASVIRNPLIDVSTFIPLYFACGVLMYFILRSKEIAQHKLEKAQFSARSVIQSSLGFFFFLDKDLKIVSFNNFAKEVFKKDMHLDLKEGASIFNYFPPETHESFRITLNKCLAGETIRNEKQVTFPGGPTVWVENTFIPVYDDNKKFLGISFQTQRINERKEAEIALKESEEKFRQLADNIEDGFWLGTPEKFLYINNAFEKIWGIKKEDLMKDPSLLRKSMYPEDLEELEKINPKTIRETGATNQQYRIVHPDGILRWIWARRFPVLDDQGRVYRTVGIVSDITENKNAQQALIDSEVRFRQLAESAFEGLLFHDDGIIMDANKQLADMIGYEVKDLIGKSILDLAHPAYHDLMRKSLRIPYEIEIFHRNGKLIPIEILVKPFVLQGRIARVAAIRDISERKNAEAALKESQVRFKEMADTLPLLVYETDVNGNITYFNKAAFEYTGYTLEDFDKGLTLAMMFPPGEMERAMENAKRTMSGTYVGAIEYTLKRKDGTLFPAIINTVPYLREGKVAGRRGVVTDISEIKKTEAMLKASLMEKDILLHEIHHRVKNNLQVVSSLMNLQSVNISDNRIREIFNDAQSRVFTMSLVHDKLYKADNFSSINISDYVHDLINSIESSHNFDKERIQIKINVQPLSLNLDTMIPVGLIINELVTNSLKHAFPDGKKGCIEILFKKEDDASLLLCVIDDGIGIPDDIDIENIASLGLRLVQTLTTQINGELSIHNNNGSRFCIAFAEVQKKHPI